MAVKEMQSETLRRVEIDGMDGIGGHTEPTGHGPLVRKIPGHLARVEAKEADRGTQCLGVCATAMQNIHPIRPLQWRWSVLGFLMVVVVVG